MIVYTESETLAQDLGIPASTLFSVSFHLGRHYHRVEIPKRDGGTRLLSVPDPILKRIQRAVLRVLLFHIPISPYATAYRPGVGIRNNAVPHCGRKAVLRLDILHFFDSVRYSQIKEKVFPAAVYSEKLRVLLSCLCYGRDGLPQGAPTSPVISNILLREFDFAMGDWCHTRGIRYTRYCDDMIFSGDFDPAPVIRMVAEALQREGFRLNTRKIRFARQGQRQSVTGIVVNERPRMDSGGRRALRAALYYCQKYGVKDHLARMKDPRTEEEYLCSLLGQLDFALSLSKEPELAAGRGWVLEQLRALSSSSKQ